MRVPGHQWVGGVLDVQWNEKDAIYWSIRCVGDLDATGSDSKATSEETAEPVEDLVKE